MTAQKNTSFAKRQPQVLGRINNLDTRLAASAAEIHASQRLRYQVFYEEMGATPDSNIRNTKIDSDKFDEFCYHLLVIDNAMEAEARRTSPGENIVGTYRLLSARQSTNVGGFYSSNEFDIEALMARHRDKKFLEFGRSCVLPAYRNKRTIELLWQGSWAHVIQHKVDVMFGCASLQGTDPENYSQSLSFLYHHARAKQQWRIKAKPARAIDMNRITKDALDKKQALRQLPPLIKGYLRLGAQFGEEAVIDHQFGTIDVMVILPIANLNSRYVNYYGSDAQRHRVVSK